MHVLISGAGGFVGGAMARAFVQAGWTVTGICRKRRPPDLPAKQFSVVMTELETCSGLPHRYDVLVHCAAEIPACCPDDKRLYRNNVEGTKRLLDHAASAGATAALHMSSMAVYGEVSRPVAAENTPFGEAGVYGKSKAESERAVAAWASGNRAAVSIRLPGVVGRGGHDNFLCDSLRKILAGEPVPARHPEALFNNVVHVEDLAAFAAALPGRMAAGHEALTVAAEAPLPIREVLSRMHRRAGKPERVSWQAGGSAPFLISFEHARALGYRPASVADSVERFVADALPEANAR